MKQIFSLALLMAAAQTRTIDYLARPVSDDYLWVGEEGSLNRVEVRGERLPFDGSTLQINEQIGAKDTRIVPIEFSNPLKSPGIFLRHNFDIL